MLLYVHMQRPYGLLEPIRTATSTFSQFLSSFEKKKAFDTVQLGACESRYLTVYLIEMAFSAIIVFVRPERMTGNQIKQSMEKKGSAP